MPTLIQKLQPRFLEFSENLSFLFMIFYFFGALLPGQSLPVIHQPWLFILGKMEAFIRVFRIISGNLCLCQNIRKIENKILFLHEYTFRKNNLDQVLTKKKKFQNTPNINPTTLDRSSSSLKKNLEYFLLLPP